MKKNNKKGFTLAELLIVVAIIAVLVAIAIPIFNSQLEKSREATDSANIRDIYAEIAVGLIDGTLVADNDAMTVMNGLTATYSATNKTVTVANFPVAQRVDDWQGIQPSVAGITLVKPSDVSTGATVSLEFEFDTENNGGGEHTFLKAITW